MANVKTTVEQNRIKRAGVGLRACDPDLASPGYTLFAPLTTETTVYLIGLEGKVAHTWTMPYSPGLYGSLTAEGTLLYRGRTIEDSTRFIASQPWKGGVILEADWNGRILWEARHPDHHHDAVRLRNGNLLLLCLDRLPPEIAARVQGGQAGTEHQGEMYADYLVEMTVDGRVVWEWRTWEHLDPEVDRITAVQDFRREWTHGNAVAELPDGRIVVSFRNISTVIMIERQTGAIVWKLGPPVLANQHAPTPLANGNLLIFDNGTHRLDHPASFSRVIEVNPETKEIAWSYQEERLVNFFAPHISNAQRLPNGNTLICAGTFGCLFEVTPEREVVWEYVNPYFGLSAGQLELPPANHVFRAFRYSPEEIAAAARTA